VELSFWQRLERDWLGLRAGAWRERAMVAGFEADAVYDYCGSCGVSKEAGKACVVCAKEAPSRRPWGRIVRLGEYRGVLREAVLEAKYTAMRALAADVGVDLGLAVAEALRLERAGRPGVQALREVMVVPIPTSLRRQLRRGMDHALVMAGGVARGLRSGVDAQVRVAVVSALRREHRPPQQGMSATDRQRNVAGTMRLVAGKLGGGSGTMMVVVDDVLTTGATMREAFRAAREGLDDQMEAWAAVGAIARSGENPLS
jgi:predicted amidophosphoribosyltransferase